jgi:predicted nucleotidyltransferase
MSCPSVRIGITPEQRKTIVETLLPYGVSRIAVFGSYATGRQQPGSDLDLIISCTHPLGLFTLGGIREELMEKLGVEVDLLTERAVNPLLAGRIGREAVEIFPHEE